MSHSKKGVDVSPPWNFSWVVANQLAAMAWPETESNLKFLLQEGISHLVTLSREKRPPVHFCPELKWTEIDIEEFEAPSVEQIKTFIDICEKCKKNNQAVGVHCRMGRGRTGVMAACYLVHFYEQHPGRAVINLRKMRPGSVETSSQERVVTAYHDYLRSL